MRCRSLIPTGCFLPDMAFESRRGGVEVGGLVGCMGSAPVLFTLEKIIFPIQRSLFQDKLGLKFKKMIFLI